ncbi:MAG: hypothetical protein ABFS08_09250 [Pseudomonadota bacterium]
MKRPGFLQGVGVALAAALLGEVVFVALAPLLGSVMALHMVIASTSFLYIIYLLRSSGVRLGRMTTLLGWLLIIVVTAWMEPALMVYALVHVAMIWLVRSLYFYSGLLPAVADLGLNFVAVAAVVWATAQSGSLMLALWCFFLLQAVFVVIPRNMNKPLSSADGVIVEEDRFEQAHRTAQAALRKLSSVH